jgi:hypothetical protein
MTRTLTNLCPADSSSRLVKTFDYGQRATGGGVAMQPQAQGGGFAQQPNAGGLRWRTAASSGRGSGRGLGRTGPAAAAGPAGRAGGVWRRQRCPAAGTGRTGTGRTGWRLGRSGADSLPRRRAGKVVQAMADGTAAVISSSHRADSSRKAGPVPSWGR